MMELMKILETYAIKDKLFGVVTDNASNNGTLKDELEKAMNRREFRWDRTQKRDISRRCPVLSRKCGPSARNLSIVIGFKRRNGNKV